MSWAAGRMLAFDTETTGVDPAGARIITAAAVLIGDGEPQTHSWLVNPGVDIPAEATAVHGVTTEHAREQGMPSEVAIPAIATMIRQHLAEGIPLVAFNACYDLTVLNCELVRCGLEPIPVRELVPVIDPMVIDKEVDPYRKGKRTLADCCATYHVRQDGAHTAEGDALAAARLAWVLAGQFPQIGKADLVELHAQQIMWRAGWAEQFEAHLRRTSQPDAEVDGSWPARMMAEQSQVGQP